MTNSMSETRGVNCYVCRARVGEPCVGRKGGERRWPHEVRLQTLMRQARTGSPQMPLTPQPTRMTEPERSARRERIRQVPCADCGAGPGEKCRSRRPEGRLSTHSARGRAWDLAGRP